MQETVSFDSHGLKLSGVVRIPDNAKGKVPAFLLLHGFGSNKEAHWMYLTAELLAKWGYASIRFDMRGCGESEGARGRVFEVTNDKQIVWEYMEPPSKFARHSNAVYRAYRIPYEWLPQVKKPQEKAVHAPPAGEFVLPSE